MVTGLCAAGVRRKLSHAPVGSHCAVVSSEQSSKAMRPTGSIALRFDQA